jgi:hypothetical protein
MVEVTKSLKRLISQFRDRYQAFESAISWDRFVEASLQKDDVDLLRDLVPPIINDYDELRNLLRRRVRDASRLTGLKPAEQRYFAEVIEPRGPVFFRISLWSLFNSLDSDGEWLRRELKAAKERVSNPERDSILKAFDTGLARMKNDEDTLRNYDWFDELDIDGALELVESKMFRPDLWHEHAESIRPVLLGKYPAVNNQLRLRLDDLYKSYILGQYLSGIAMARSVLEYTLATWAKKRRFDDREPHLEGLIKLVTDKEPSLSEDRLNIVRLNGNAIMHPEVVAHDNVVEFPPNEGTCQRCIKIVVETIETLQSDLA